MSKWIYRIQQINWSSEENDVLSGIQDGNWKRANISEGYGSKLVHGSVTPNGDESCRDIGCERPLYLMAARLSCTQTQT